MRTLLLAILLALLFTGCRTRESTLSETEHITHRDTLHTMNAGLVFHLRIDTVTINHKYNFFKSADSIFIGIHSINFPAVLLCIFAIHPV